MTVSASFARKQSAIDGLIDHLDKSKQDEVLQPVDVPLIRQKLREIADKARAEIQQRAGRCLRGIEWGNIPLAHRMAVLLMAGVDGDLQELARKSWPEFTPGERESIAVAIRSMHASLHACNALRVKA
jgi:hypothetical protein